MDGQNEKNPSPRGIYGRVNISVRAINAVIIVGILVLIAVTVFLVMHGGFTVSFDTNGGSYVESQKRMHGELVEPPEPPVSEGRSFTGWYLDRDCTLEWDMSSDAVTESVTLYAGWTEDGE